MSDFTVELDIFGLMMPTITADNSEVRRMASRRV